MSWKQSRKERPQLFIWSSFYLFFGSKIYYWYFLQIALVFYNLVGEKIRAVLDVGRNCIRGDEGLSLTAPTDHKHFLSFSFCHFLCFLVILCFMLEIVS